MHTLFIISDIAVLLGVFRQMQAAERKGNELADVRYHLALFEIKQHDARLPGIRGMTKCELQAFLSIGNLIKVPLLNAQRRGLDVCTAVCLHGPGRPPRLDDAAAVQHIAGRFNLLLVHGNAPPFAQNFYEVYISCFILPHSP